MCCQGEVTVQTGYLQVVSVGVIISSSEWLGADQREDEMEGKKNRKTEKGKQQINVSERNQQNR